MKSIVLLAIFACVVYAANNNIHVETTNFVVNVVGNQNVPKYNFYLKNNASNVYSVQFSQLYECVPVSETCQKNGRSNIALPSLTWAFSAINETNSTINFNITATNNPQFSELKFVNHLNKTGNDTTIKIDVLINGYSWVSGADAKLVLSYAVSGDNLIFNVAPTANSTISGSVGVAYTTKGNERYTTYDHFSGNLTHDPTIGIEQAQPNSATVVFAAVPLLVAALALLF